MIGVPFVRPDATVQVNGPAAGIVAKVVQVTPSVDEETEYDTTVLPGNDAELKLTVAV